jgi:hypothetical protein
MCSFCGCRTEVRPTSNFKFCGCRTEVQPTSSFKFCGCRAEVRPTGSFIVKYTRLNNYATDTDTDSNHRYSKTDKNAKQAITNYQWLQPLRLNYK